MREEGTTKRQGKGGGKGGKNGRNGKRTKNSWHLGLKRTGEAPAAQLAWSEGERGASRGSEEGAE